MTQRRVAMVVGLGLASGLGACGGPDAEPDAAVDAPPDSFGDCAARWTSICNPLSPPDRQGCPAGQKCTWVVVTDTPETTGIVACVPDGDVDLDQPCTPSADNVGDDCRAGLVCVEGTCHDICGFDGSFNAACAAGLECGTFDGLFEWCGGDPIAGACVPACDPLTQLYPDGSSCGVGRGCYLLIDSTGTHAVCAEAGTAEVGQVLTGTVYANSCVPGAQPRPSDHTGGTIECGGLCRPNDVTSTVNQADEEGVAPDSCTARWGAPPASDTVAGESCRYLWGREATSEVTPYSNTVGWCFPHAETWYDSDGDLVPDTPTPRCTDLTDDDVVPPIEDPPESDARSFWCRSRPMLPLARPVAASRVHLDRLAP